MKVTLNHSTYIGNGAVETTEESTEERDGGEITNKSINGIDDGFDNPSKGIGEFVTRLASSEASERCSWLDGGN